MPITQEETDAIKAGYEELLRTAMANFYDRVITPGSGGVTAALRKDIKDAVLIARTIKSEFETVLSA
jgi:hypothetical protein